MCESCQSDRLKRSISCVADSDVAVDRISCTVPTPTLNRQWRPRGVSGGRDSGSTPSLVTFGKGKTIPSYVLATTLHI